MSTQVDCSTLIVLGIAAFWLLLLSIGVVAAIYAFRGLRKSGARHGLDVAEQILAARFARGDLSLEEYSRRLEELRRVHDKS